MQVNCSRRVNRIELAYERHDEMLLSFRSLLDSAKVPREKRVWLGNQNSVVIST